MFLENKMVDERISRAIDNDHTAAMKAPGDSKKHMRKKTSSIYSTDNMITVCMLCKKAFKNQLFYRKHLRIHSEKASVCPICGKSFAKKHILQTHMQTHGKHQFQCHLCHKRFTQKGNLNQHLKFHTTKKTYKCNMCDKDFYQQEHLKTHIRHHNNERPFECEICHKSFNIKSSLQRHMNCHTGEKPFICDICNRGYTRRSVLMLHIQQVHENKKPFQCDECHLCFSQKGNLQAHFRRKHLQPKSEGKRSKDKDGSKGKRSIKRQHGRTNSKTVKICTNKNFVSHFPHSDESSKSKLNKSRMDNTTLHSYASKVKSIVNRNSRAQVRVPDDQKIVNKSPSKSSPTYENGSVKEQMNGQSTSYNSLKFNLASFDNSSSCSLSDETVDIGCSSSSSEDIPELNFPSIFENHADAPYDIKALPDDFDALLDGRGWEEYMLVDTDNILSSALPHYDLLCSPTKSNIVLSKTSSGGPEELFSIPWNDDYTTNPLFTADDLDEIKDISSICSVNSTIQNSLEGIKFDPEKRVYNQNSKTANHYMQKLNPAGSSIQV
ncbi:Zinc finger protein 510, partial [Stegodyphus mimosarum]